jgi:hypothetical protein
VTRIAKADFLTSLGLQGEPPPSLASLPLRSLSGKRVVRVVFIAAFVLMWVENVAFFCVFDAAFRNGARTPTAEKSERLENHAAVAYETASEKRLRVKTDDLRA